VHDVALGRAIALAAFMWTYVGLALGRVPGFRVDRTGVAIIGAAVMVVTGVIPWDRAVASVDAKSVIPTFGEPARGWLILAMASTLAGNLTLLGSVANLIVVEVARGERVQVGFVEYCRVGVPLTVLTLLAGWLILALVPV